MIAIIGNSDSPDTNTPRVVRLWERPYNTYRLIHTGAAYELQEDRGGNWFTVSQEDKFAILCQLVDPKGGL